MRDDDCRTPCWVGLGLGILSVMLAAACSRRNEPAGAVETASTAAVARLAATAIPVVQLSRDAMRLAGAKDIDSTDIQGGIAVTVAELGAQLDDLRSRFCEGRIHVVFPGQLVVRATPDLDVAVLKRALATAAPLGYRILRLAAEDGGAMEYLGIEGAPLVQCRNVPSRGKLTLEQKRLVEAYLESAAEQEIEDNEQTGIEADRDRDGGTGTRAKREGGSGSRSSDEPEPALLYLQVERGRFLLRWSTEPSSDAPTVVSKPPLGAAGYLELARALGEGWMAHGSPSAPRVSFRDDRAVLFLEDGVPLKELLVTVRACRSVRREGGDAGKAEPRRALGVLLSTGSAPPPPPPLPAPSSQQELKTPSRR